jgi:TolB protein
MTEFGAGNSSRIRFATLALATFAIFGTGYATQTVDAQTTYDKRFDTLDKNGDKRLQIDEYVRHVPAKEDILRRDFKLFDLDRSKGLTLSEFKTTPLVTPLKDRDPLPDPLDAFVDHAIAAMDHSFDSWDLHPERNVPAWTFVQLFIATFGSNTTRPDVNEVDENRDGNISRREARRFLEIQAGVRRHNGDILRQPDGRVINLSLFRQVDKNSSDRIDEEEFDSIVKVGTSFAEVIKLVDLDKDERISFDEWSKVPSLGQISPIEEFRRLDKNLDARVDKVELLAGGPAWKLKMSSCVFPGFDTDSDGLLTLDEYRMTMQANPIIRWYMPVADLDGDHELTFSEFKFDTSRYVLLRWLYFNRLDTNGDGVLTTSEFDFKVKSPDEFFIVNADGSGWKSLFRFKTHFACGSPDVSPDGKTLAFDAWSVKPRTSPTIFKMDIGTTKPRKIASGSMPSWSPDGKRFACSQSGVRMINADGCNPMGIRDSGWGAQWSPDGKSIAFVEGFIIKTYNVQTKKFREVLRKHDYKQIFWNMAWSPDSRSVCFKGEKANGTLDVVTLDIASESPTLKVHHSTQLNINADFAWHPDGDRIAFGMYCQERKKLQIYELNPTNDEPPTLFPGQDETRNNNDVCWTPNGEQLIVVSGDF